MESDNNRLKIWREKKITDNQIAFYQSPDGSVNIEVLFAEENIWLTQKKWPSFLIAQRTIFHFI